MPPLYYNTFRHKFSSDVQITIGLYTQDFAEFNRRLIELVKNPKEWTHII